VRKCHFCQEGIADLARVCPHCSSDLIHRPPVQDAGGFAETGALGFIKDRLATFDENHPTMRRVLQYGGLFVTLMIIYAIYLQGIIEGMIENGPDEIMPGDLVWALVKFCLISGAPFAVVAYADREWERENVAPVALAAWVAVFGYCARKYGVACPAAFALFFLPLVFSAIVAHKIGRRPIQNTALSGR
jgi:hypothetical protein